MKPKFLRDLAAAVVTTQLCVGLTSAQSLIISPDRPDGTYAVGDTVRWTFEWKGDTPPPPSARYVLKSGGLKEAGAGPLSFEGNTARLETKFTEPGTMLVEATWDPAAPANRSSGGAVAAPNKILPAAPEPADFDTFWKSKLDELAAVPPNPELSPPDTSLKPGVAYQKITLDNVRGTHINGQLARPEKGDKLPALLIVQWAGVYPLQKPWALDRAAEGWLTLNILPHDLPIDQPESFYKDQFAGPLKNYWAIGNDDRDTSYYLRMYLSCYRAVEYLRSRPDWDGKTLVVMGTSQGGQQTLVTAGLHPGVTAALAFLPAACDVMAPDIGRASGFPFWYTQVHGKDPAKVRQASKYYDPVNFARRIKCPVLIGLALRDDLAPPASVLAAANVITSPKEVVTLAKAGHQDERGSQKPYNDRCYGEWLPALRQENSAPIAQAQTDTATAPVTMTAEEDHRRTMALLKIDKLRRGADYNPTSPHAANADESKATTYTTLPDPLRFNDGTPVASAQDWLNRRRAEIVELFDREIYGRVPKNVPAVKWELVSTTDETRAGIPVVTKELLGRVDNSACPQITVAIQMRLTIPKSATAPVPVAMEFTFGRPRGAATRPALATSRPGNFGPSGADEAVKRGWAYAAVVPTSIQADNGAGLTQGIIGLANRGQPRSLDDWGSLRAWAWGASRALDYLQTDPAVDPNRVSIAGLSRYGKAALVTMACDERFAAGLIGSSGAGGAKIFRRDLGERVENLASAAKYHWFAGNFLKYAGPLTTADLPVDAHELIALCAPRPVFISAGAPSVEGTWVDAHGTYLAAVAATPVYKLLGKTGLAQQDPTAAPADGDLAYRQHEGGHTIGPNWPFFFDFASRHLGASPH